MKNSFSQSIEQSYKKKWNHFNLALENLDVKVTWDKSFLEEIKSVFIFSDFVASSCINNPQILVGLKESGELSRKYPPGYFKKRLYSLIKLVVDEKEFKQTLRRFRRREMVRIAWRDLAGKSDLEETLSDLSMLADTCIDHTLSFLNQNLCKIYGVPVGQNGSQMDLSVVGMGKLGGQELNFSSDVDLIFIYPEDGETKGRGKTISNDKYFTILCRKFLKILGEVTEDGFVFHVDTRLRPYGENGPLVMGFEALEQYCQQQGREWERYAWIKARIVAGDQEKGENLLERLKPFVYRRYLDFSAFESMRSMKKKIELEVKRKGMKENIKLGPGGIREIEFFGQIFQLIRGGVTPPLQERKIRKVISNLAAEGYIPVSVSKELDEAYVFLRRIENRLQAFSDHQTHALPTDSVDRHRLALSMNFNDEKELMHHLEMHRSKVHTHFTMLLTPQESDDRDLPIEKEWESVWLGLMEKEKAILFLSLEGFDEPDKIVELLDHMRNTPAIQALGLDGRQRLDKLVPMLLMALKTSEKQVLVMGRIFDLIQAILGRTSYLALLIENPGSLAHLVNLTSKSPFIASFLTQHPVLLDELLDPRTLYAPPKRSDIENELNRRMGRLPDDLEYQMEELRVFKQAQVLRVCAADVTQAMPLMKVSDHLTDIAEAIVDYVLQMAWEYLKNKHGKPICFLNNQECTLGFAVVAYGKFGGFELGYGSDLDLVFLHAGTNDYTSKSDQAIHNNQFFARLGQRVVHILTAPTRAGSLYETDTRLRPSGSSGILVSHIEAYREYQLNDAWTWEHQALIKARAIGGDELLMRRFEQIRKEVLALQRNQGKLKADVSGMREKMQKELLHVKKGIFDLKQSPGGIVDIEFLVQYLVLRHARNIRGLLKRTDIVGLLYMLLQSGIINGKTANLLRYAYLVYRAVAHKLSLQEQSPHVAHERFQILIEKINRSWFKYLDDPRK